LEADCWILLFRFRSVAIEKRASSRLTCWPGSDKQDNLRSSKRELFLAKALSLLRTDESKSVLVKAASLPIAGLASLFANKIVLDQTGVVSFGLFSLCVTFPLLIPISDWGLGANLTNALASNVVWNQKVEFVFRKLLKILFAISAVTIAFALFLGNQGFWNSLLGAPNRKDLSFSVTAVLVIMSLGIPLGLGQRVLLAKQKQSLVTLVISLGSVFSFVNVLILRVMTCQSLAPYVVGFSLGPLIVQSFAAVLAMKERARDFTDVRVPEAVGNQDHIRLANVGVPMAVITIVLPLSFQSDRLVIENYLGPAAIAGYSAVALIYSPLLSIITAGTTALWPRFIRNQQSREARKRQTIFSVTSFTALGISLGLFLLFAGPTVTSLVTHDSKVAIDASTYWYFALLLVVLGFNSSISMLFMDPNGLRFQAAISTIMFTLKLPLALILTPNVGQSGPVLATLLALFVAVSIPLLVRTRRLF
jgi:O-antigen/teichoic acid export membrane protein